MRDKFKGIRNIEKNISERIFKEIDIIIELCKSNTPSIWDKSKFKLLYEELKKKWHII